MYSNNLPNILADSAGYAPYFYQSGLFPRHDSPPDAARRSPYLPASPSYDSPSLDSLTQRFDHGQTVEQVIANGYFAIPSGDPVSAIISDKQHTFRLGLDDVIGQIRRRYEIYQDNLYQIDLAKCAAANAIYKHEAYAGPPTSKQTYAKHKAIQDLYQQEREERANHWKDVSRLRLLLPESAQNYLSAYRKVSALADHTGDPG